MPDHTTLRRPSDHLPELRDQLLRELDRLDRGGDAVEEPCLFRGYLKRAEALAWQGVAKGNLDAPREILDHLLAARPFVDRHLPEVKDPAAQAALETHALTRSLYLAIQAADEIRTELRPAENWSPVEKAILSVLVENQGTYLRRGDVHAKLKLDNPLTSPRIGQILVHFYHEGLVRRIHGRAQGSPNASFYALSPKGVEVCRSLGLEKLEACKAEGSADSVSQETKVLSHAVEILLDPHESLENQSVAVGSLANSRIEKGRVLERLETELSKDWNGPTVDLFARAVCEFLLTRLAQSRPPIGGNRRPFRVGSRS